MCPVFVVASFGVLMTYSTGEAATKRKFRLVSHLLHGHKKVLSQCWLTRVQLTAAGIQHCQQAERRQKHFIVFLVYFIFDNRLCYCFRYCDFLLFSA